MSTNQTTGTAERISYIQVYARIIVAALDNELPDPVSIGLTETSNTWHVQLPHNDRAAVDRWAACLGTTATDRSYSSWCSHEVDEIKLAWLPGYEVRIHADVDAVEVPPPPAVVPPTDDATVADRIRAAADAAQLLGALDCPRDEACRQCEPGGPTCPEAVPAGMKPGQQLAYSVVDNRDVSTIYLGPDAAGMPFESAVGYIDGPIGGVADSDLHRYPTATAAFAGHQALVDGLRGPNWLAPSGDEEPSRIEPTSRFRDCAGCGDYIWPGEKAYPLTDEFADVAVRCAVCNVKAATDAPGGAE